MPAAGRGAAPGGGRPVAGDGNLRPQQSRLPVDGEAGSFVLRVERPGNRGLVDRKTEAEFSRMAERLGLGPRVVLAVPEQGLMLIEAVPDAHPLAAMDVSGAELLGKLLARLHGAAAAFDGLVRPPVFVPSQRLEEMLLAAEADGAAQEDLAFLRQAAAGLAAVPQVLTAPCHCDLVPGNILGDGTRLWLIDWEYAGWSDPAWDLAYAVLECGLDQEAEAALLAAHAAGLVHGHDPELMRLRVAAMKPVCDGISALWALGQAARGNDAADFRAFAAERLARARRCIGA
ncbi:phosphotransferase [Pannonibacter phragmitetus]|uniref:phosphotransferase n=1 Tax=Pannonibacter phragmitetus TaxID=121719 RepID=UPI003D2ECEF5